MPEPNLSGIFRYAMGIEYRGTRYCGWQRQEAREANPAVIHASASVQFCVETALGKVADQVITTICAGRTDSGVHAREQVIHFETRAQRPLKAWTLGVNAHLPDDIGVRWAHPVESGFHARFSATARTYRYVIHNRTSRPAIARELATWERRVLDANVMHEAAQVLPGEQDFTSFRGSQCQSNTPFRCVHHVSVMRAGDGVLIEIKANAFLHHMVRNIVGSLLLVGRGDKPPSWFRELLLARDRKQAAATAPANGLYLVHVDYPERYGLPQLAPQPLASFGAGVSLFC